MVKEVLILDDELIDKIATLSPKEQRDYLFLVPHDQFVGRWKVDALDASFMFDFEDMIGKYRTVSPATLEAFLDYAHDLNYMVVFEQDPVNIVEAYKHLNDPPKFSLNSDLPRAVPGTGMLPFQLQGFNYLRNLDNKGGYAVWDTGPQPLTSPVLTPSGWSKIGDLKIGDRIIGRDGEAYRVRETIDRGVQEVFEITFRDASVAYSTGDHLWGVYDGCSNYYVRPLSSLLNVGLFYNGGDARWKTPRCQPVKFDSRPVAVDPYLLGAMLGDGSMTSSVPQFYSHQGELIPYLEPLLPQGMRVSTYGPKHFAFVGQGRGRPNALKTALKEIGVWGHTAETKFIPFEYKYNSIPIRLGVLQGLCDTDGSAERQTARISTISKRLANDIAEIVRSLGGRAIISEKDEHDSLIAGKVYACKRIYRVSFSIPKEFEYFRLARKKVPVRPLVNRNSIIKIIPIGKTAVCCLSTTAPDGLYITSDYVVTHNTGKTALIAALIKQHMDIEQAYDFALVVVKKNNKYDMQKKLEALGDIASVVIDGNKAKREKIYDQISLWSSAAIPTIAIVNYEKFRDDYEYFSEIAEGERLLIFWDEMPTKLSNRTTILYESVQSILFDSAPRVVWKEKRPAELRQYGLSATPVENTPVGVLNQIRLIDPDVWPTIAGWEKRFVSKRNYFSRQPEEFRDLELIGLEIEFMTHQVDKSDPDIADMFPSLIEEPIYIDWGPDRKYYDKLQAIAEELAKEAKDGEGKAFNALQIIGALQMICDAPSMINTSAENRDAFDELLAEAEIEGTEVDLGGLTTGSEAAQILADAVGKPLEDTGSQKMDKLHELLTVKHPDDKFIVFTAFADYIFPILEAKFDEWGVTYRTYRGTDKQKQEAKDQWRNDSHIRIFLSSDSGSDSIDLPEAGVVVHYDLPWSWAKVIQRQNRAHRINSTHEQVWVYTLLMAQSVEDRKVEIISRKLGFHRGIYKGEIAEEALSARMTAQDIWYILTGERED